MSEGKQNRDAERDRTGCCCTCGCTPVESKDRTEAKPAAEKSEKESN
ncbi:MAG: hypothetical protein AB1473_16290 [Thermodesulfobacteriota bacterium]